MVQHSWEDEVGNMGGRIGAGSCWILASVGRRKSTSDSGLFSLFLAWHHHSVVMRVRAHLVLLGTAAERKKTLICVGEKLENVLRLQPAASETRGQIHHLCYFLLKRVMVWGTQGMLVIGIFFKV